MYHTEIIVRQHHAVLLRSGIVRIDLGVAGIMMSCQVDCFLADRVGDRAIHFIRHCQLNRFHYILECGFSCFFADLSKLDFGRVGDQMHIINIHDALLINRILYIFDHMDPDLIV